MAAIPCGKTWGFWQYKRETPLPLFMEAFRHQMQQQTLAYLCIQVKEVAQIFEREL
jgi:predicted solute-binding protein